MKSLNFPGRKMRHQLAAYTMNEQNIAKLREEFSRTKDAALSAKITRCEITLRHQRSAVKYDSVNVADGIRSKRHSKDRAVRSKA